MVPLLLGTLAAVVIVAGIAVAIMVEVAAVDAGVAAAEEEEEVVGVVEVEVEVVGVKDFRRNQPLGAGTWYFGSVSFVGMSCGDSVVSFLSFPSL